MRISPLPATPHTVDRYKQAEKNNDNMKMNIMLHKKKKGKPRPHSGTFGFARHTSRPLAKTKEPSYCQLLTDQA